MASILPFNEVFVCLQKKVYFFLESVFDFLKVDKKVISVKFLEL